MASPSRSRDNRSVFKRIAEKRMALKLEYLLVIVIALLVCMVGYLYAKNLQAEKKVSKLSSSQQADKGETERLVKKVGTIVVLPEGENPTVATVVDSAKLKSQAFFIHAEKGDKVLIYTQSKKAYLYRPSTNKLIEVAPLNIDPKTQAQPQPTPTKR